MEASRRRAAWLAAAGAWLLPALLCVSVAGGFDPSVSLLVTYNDNVAFVGEPGESSADSTVSLTAQLPWKWVKRRSNYALEYRPTLVTHNTFSDLNRMENRLNFSYGLRPSERSNLNLRTAITFSQIQGDARSEEDPDLFLTERTNRRLGRVDLAYSRTMNRRWSWDTSIGASLATFEAIEGFEPTSPQSVEDRGELRVAAGLRRKVAKYTDLGGSYGVGFDSLEFNGDQTVQDLSLTVSHIVDEDFSVNFRLGAFLRTGEASNAEGDPDGSTTGVAGTLGLSRTFRRLSLGFNLRHAPSAGGARAGTSTNTAAGLALAGVNTRSWNWNMALRYARRDPTLADEQTIESGSLGAGLEFYLGRAVGLSLRANYVDQISGDSADDGSYVAFAAGLVWYPKGRRLGSG